MPRLPVDDYLLSHHFHILDVDYSLALPPWVLIPSAGFSSITSPELTVNARDINEGTALFPHPVLGKGTVNTIVLQRGVSPFNSDFWRWIVSCLQGKVQKKPGAELLSTLPIVGKMYPSAKRRNMMILHMTSMSPSGVAQALKAGGYASAKAVAFSPFTAFVRNDAPGGAFGDLLDYGISHVPGKMYLLQGCLPIRYKAGSDFDASSTQVSIEELEIKYFKFEEFAFTA